MSTTGFKYIYDFLKIGTSNHVSQTHQVIINYARTHDMKNSIIVCYIEIVILFNVIYPVK